jgi:hypothetical protein
MRLRKALVMLAWLARLDFVWPAFTHLILFLMEFMNLRFRVLVGWFNVLLRVGKKL